MLKSEKTIANYVGSEFALVLPRATVGIYLILKALGHSGGKVILPNISCPSPAYAVLFAGLEPLFCDVREDNYTLDPDAFEKLLCNHDDIKAVIPIHLYGYAASVDKIVEIAHKNGVFVLEDAAQSFGGIYKGQRLGSFGDASVVSFGHTKILELSEGGGVILSSDRALVDEIIKHKKDLSTKVENYSYLENQRSRIYYLLQECRKENASVDLFFRAMPWVFKDLYLYDQPCELTSIVNSINDLEYILIHRREMASLLHDLLSAKYVSKPIVDFDGSAIWRYTFRVDRNKRELLLNETRKRGIDISSWYPQLHKWFDGPKVNHENFEVSEKVENEVVNLWVDGSVDKVKTERTANIINEVLLNAE